MPPRVFDRRRGADQVEEPRDDVDVHAQRVAGAQGLEHPVVGARREGHDHPVDPLRLDDLAQRVQAAEQGRVDALDPRAGVVHAAHHGQAPLRVAHGELGHLAGDVARAQDEHALRREAAGLVGDLPAGQPRERRGERDDRDLGEVDPPAREGPDGPDEPGGQDRRDGQAREAAQADRVLLGAAVAARQRDHQRREGGEDEGGRAARPDAGGLPLLVEERDAGQGGRGGEEQDGRERVPRDQRRRLREPGAGARPDHRGDGAGSAFLDGERAHVPSQGLFSGRDASRFHKNAEAPTPPVRTDLRPSKGEPGAGPRRRRPALARATAVAGEVSGRARSARPAARRGGTTPQRGGPGLHL